MGSPPPRASDADREAAAERLRLAMRDGRLTVDELEDRLGAARTQTRAAPDLLVADLPDAPVPAVSPARVPVRRGVGGARWVVSVLGGADRHGRWRLAPRCRVVNVMAGADLDLTDAEFADDRVELTVFSLMGGCRIVVPDALNVEVSKFALMGGQDVDLGHEPADPGGPVLHVRLISIMAGAEVIRTSAAALVRRRRRVGRGRPRERLDG
ncbi:MAG: DUF1707 SHOCT-like domain-containing protein [Solirubrobacteraceae bacterium]